jgi:hypothetical protein
MPQTLRTHSSPYGTRRKAHGAASSIRGAVKSLLLVLFAGLALALGHATPASAGIPCWQAVINDWYDNGQVDQKYAPSCYSDAIKHLPRDVDTYSSAKDDIKRAELAALRGGGGGPDQSSPATDSNARSASSSTPPASKPESSGKGPLIRTIEWLGPSDAASVPVPLLILAGVAFLLLAAAGGSFISRRLQTRRLPPPQQP